MVVEAREEDGEAACSLGAAEDETKLGANMIHQKDGMEEKDAMLTRRSRQKRNIHPRRKMSPGPIVLSPVPD